MGRELGAMMNQWVWNQQLRYINELGIRSYDISMSWELATTMNINGQGMRSYNISMGVELGAMI